MDDHSTSQLNDSFDPVADVEEFHKKFGLEYNGPPRILPPELFHFRVKFVDEENTEYKDAVINIGLPPEFIARLGIEVDITQALNIQLDSLADLVYVALGTAYMQGFNFREAWRRVHVANMSKIRCERAGDSTRNSTYDVIKGPDFVPPDHTDLVRDHAHRVDTE